MLGKATPKKVLAKVLKQERCARWREGGCSQTLTVEHAFGRSGPRSHLCIRLCEKHHGLGDYWNKAHFNKRINELHAYLTISDEELSRMKCGSMYLQEKRARMKEFAHLL